MMTASPFSQRPVERIQPGYTWTDRCPDCEQYTTHIWYSPSHIACQHCQQEAERRDRSYED